MSDDLIATTSSERLRPLGTPAQRSFELVTGTIERRLGTAHAQLFGEPVTTSYGHRMDWYSPLSGRVRPLSALDEAETAQARERLDQIVADIRALADEIGKSSDPEEQRLAEAIRNALEIPGTEAIHVIDTGDAEHPMQPVLVNWAHVRDEHAAVRGVLAGRDRRPTPLAAAPVVAAASVTGQATTQTHDDRGTGSGFGTAWLAWLLWLLLALVLLAILYLLIPACALRGLPMWSYCPAAQPVSSTEFAEMRRLEDEIGQLERRIAIADRACQPEAPPPAPVPADIPAPPPSPPDEEDTEMNRRLEEAGAQRGDLGFSLAWDNISDLDLHVTCANGQEISFRNRSACGGTLDVDANAGANRRPDPVENVFFDNPAPGTYRVTVHLYDWRGANGPNRFRLQVRDGDRVRNLRGGVRPNKRTWTRDFEIGGN